MSRYLLLNRNLFEQEHPIYPKIKVVLIESTLKSNFDTIQYGNIEPYDKADTNFHEISQQEGHLMSFLAEPKKRFSKRWSKIQNLNL